MVSFFRISRVKVCALMVNEPYSLLRRDLLPKSSFSGVKLSDERLHKPCVRSFKVSDAINPYLQSFKTHFTVSLLLSLLKRWYNFIAGPLSTCRYHRYWFNVT